MSSTSVHFPDDLLRELDRLAGDRGISRNRLIVESCRHAVAEQRRWPEAFFAGDHLSEGDLAELRAGGEELDAALAGSRRSRREPPF